jgi:hypothetical protein
MLLHYQDMHICRPVNPTNEIVASLSMIYDAQVKDVSLAESQVASPCTVTRQKECEVGFEYR